MHHYTEWKNRVVVVDFPNPVINRMAKTLVHILYDLIIVIDIDISMRSYSTIERWLHSVAGNVDLTKE